jgi:ATP phosphoribosyltransferase regulatory subunit HisZ
MLGRQELVDAVVDRVVGKDGAEQRLLRLIVVRRLTSIQGFALRPS